MTLALQRAPALDDGPLAQLLRTFLRHSDLCQDDCDAVLGLPHQMRTLSAASYLVRDGEKPSECAILVAGFAYRQKLTVTGSRQILSIHIPGEPLDLQNLFLDVADHNVQALTQIRVAIVPRDAMRALAISHPAIGRAMLMHILIEGSMFREWLLNIGRRDAGTKIAHLLCEFAIRMEAQGLIGDYDYELPMTQEQLSDAVGLTSVHVNRTLMLLESKGLINRDRRRVSFPNWNALRAYAGFNDAYLHLKRQTR